MPSRQDPANIGAVISIVCRESGEVEFVEVEGTPIPQHLLWRVGGYERACDYGFRKTDVFMARAGRTRAFA